jgi:hypothetical protein
MCKRCEKSLGKVWPKLQRGERYATPDLYKRKDFYINDISNKGIRIVPQKITVTKEAFLATLHFLFENEHDFGNQCEIRSSNSRKTAGPLCLASRDKNSNVRCINYILPILQRCQIVGINPVRPNKTWFL